MKQTLQIGLQCYIFGFNFTTSIRMKSLDSIDFLIFDLGNVIIDIDYAFSINELKKILPQSKYFLADELYVTQFHKDYEMGHMNDAQFRDKVRAYFLEDWPDDQVDILWNNLLIEIPDERVALVRSLGNDFKTGVLSNTNVIHIKEMERMLSTKAGSPTFGSLFDHLFFSYQMGYRKPDEKIYTSIIEELGTSPERILFFDDLEENLKAAKKVGLQTFHINHPKALIRFFQDV